MNSKEWKYLFLITVVFIAACIETDIFLPALADMMQFFSVSEERIQSLLTWNFVGICLSGPFYGPISDAVGRKKPILVALALFFLGSLLTFSATNFDQMLWGRLLQGIGSGGCFTLGTAIIFDAFQEKRAVWALNQLNLIVPFLMAAAPLAGGYLNQMFGFRSNFLTIGVFVLISLFVSLFYFKETLAEDKKAPLQWKKVLGDFKLACTSVPFWQLTLVVSLFFAGYMAFLSGTSLLFVMELGVSKKLFPFFQGSLLGIWLIASLTCSRALEKWGASRIKAIGSCLIIAGAIGFVLSGWMMPKSPYAATIAMLLYTFGVNWVQGLYFPEGMEIFKNLLSKKLKKSFFQN